MSRLQSLRLAQFWRLRIELGALEKTLPAGELFEAIGWLIEGVFCGYFDPREADLVWVRMSRPLSACGVPSPPLVSESLSAEIIKLRESREPFRQSLQMTEGAQKGFELPLFPHALLLANRFYEDRLARVCTFCIRFLSEQEWHDWKRGWSSVDASEVFEKLANPDQASMDLASLLAGYLHVLEHMEASRSFFEYAKSHSPRGGDFESYCQRVGGINAWRVPLHEWDLSPRFKDLSELMEFAIRPVVEREFAYVHSWSVFQGSFSDHISSLVRAWETHHLSASLATA
jgi:hypothetical protein